MVTEENLDKFRKAYNKAIRDGVAVFMFEGQRVLVNYAKYALEYADLKMKERNGLTTKTK